MDLDNLKGSRSSHAFPIDKESSLKKNIFSYGTKKQNSYGETFDESLRKLSLKESSELVKIFPITNKITERNSLCQNSGQKRFESPSTPGRPVFSFNVGNQSRKGFPSKWDNAEKWVVSSSQESPAHVIQPFESLKTCKQHDVFQQKEDLFGERFGVTELKDQQSSSDMLLKDKFTDNEGTAYPPTKSQGSKTDMFRFKNSIKEFMKDIATEVVERRDIGTEMTPLGSSTTSRCHSPLKNPSPLRHNTPENRSGPLVHSHINISELHECHLAKLELGTQFDSFNPNWSSREEEEEDVSKSLRNFPMDDCRRSFKEPTVCVPDDDTKNNCCIRYQREEARIQAWLNLQDAKAEAQSKKLEMKIQKIRANFDEKMMKKKANAVRKAEEWRAAAQIQHSQQRYKEESEKSRSLRDSYTSAINKPCGCFRRNNI